ncbi:ArsR family transcriptional regulator [alpha proteobacterium AAP81b]|nr:ArsR family transcriptional regulator [alpha proteobacterium AAP81b]
MEIKSAAASLTALGHEGRLVVYRRLVRAGPAGLAAGVLAREVGLAPNTLSASLKVLVHAGLVTSRRDGRSVVYAAAFDHMATLIAYLVENCCLEAIALPSCIVAEGMS